MARHPLDLYWLQELDDWSNRIRTIETDSNATWNDLAALANYRLDFLQSDRLDKSLRRLYLDEPPPDLATRPVRLALLGSSTLKHLHGAIRVAALRRGLWVQIYEAEYGQYLQELLDPTSGLYKFQPTEVLFSLDARHVVAGLGPSSDEAQARTAIQGSLEQLQHCWQLARDAFGCAVLQQTLMPVLPPLMGSNETRLPGSPNRAIELVNTRLSELSEAGEVTLLSVHTVAAQLGIRHWHDPVLWNRAKQEITPLAAPWYGELAARVLAARQGRSHKCLVLDLDNTIWGGVIGDDGLEGISLGQGSALGEAFLEFQGYAKQLSERGIILAVCSKNDGANALLPFERHPEMMLRKTDISSFVANWSDKATNIRAISQELNIGLDSMVFVDDNPFERNLVRRELPMVAVPELPEDPARFSQCLADAGYFESIDVTNEDRARSRQYAANLERSLLKAQSSDLKSYLRSLDMRLIWGRFDPVNRNRIVQLINKTNQFNLTTRRYSEDEVAAVMDDPRAFGLHLRLVDRFGDNGIIAIIIGRLQTEKDVVIDTWLMSCRVLGRDIETATLDLAAAEARNLGASRLIGEYLPTAKNGMVAQHYQKLGFSTLEDGAGGRSTSVLELENYVAPETFIVIEQTTG